MGKISDKSKYPLKGTPVAGDYIIGTDSEDDNKTVTFSVASISGDGDTVQDDNKGKSVNFGYSTSADDADIVAAINGIITPITVTYDEVLYVNGIVPDPIDVGTSYRRVYAISGKGKGSYGVGGTITVAEADLILISDKQIISDPDPVTNDPNAVLEDLGEIGATALEDVVNAASPALIIGAGENWYFEFTRSAVRYVYGFTGASGIYGSGQTQTTSTDFFLIYDEGVTGVEVGAFNTLDEGNGNGIVISGRVAANFGDIGLNAFDISVSSGADSARGATGSGAFAHGEDIAAGGDNSAIISSYDAVTSGYGATVIASNYLITASGTGSGVYSATRVQNAGDYSAIVGGDENTISAAADKSVVLGGDSNDSTNLRQVVWGHSNIANSENEAVGGMFALDEAIDITGTARVFGIGIGTGTGARNTGFAVRRNGTVEMGDTGGLDTEFVVSVDTGLEALKVEYIGDDFLNVYPNGFGFNAFSGGFESLVDFVTPTANRTISFQDGDGTVAFVSDVAAVASDFTTQETSIYNSLGASNTVLLVGSGGGTNGFIGGGDSNTLNGGNYKSIVGGQGNTTASSWSAILGGRDGTIAAGTYSSIGGGRDITINDSYSFVGSGNNNTINESYSFIGSGTTNTINVGAGTGAILSGSTGVVDSQYGTILNGRNITVFSYAEIVGGLYPTEYVAVSQTAHETADRAFNIGIGTGTGARADGITVFKSGQVTAPSATEAWIDAEVTGRVLITKEWFNSNIGAAPTGLETIDEGNGDGIVKITRDDTLFGNVGAGAVHLSEGHSSVPTSGATGQYSFAANRLGTASGDSSAVFNHLTVADSNYGFACNQQAEALAQAAFACNFDTEASGTGSFASGESTIASGNYSFGSGRQGVAAGNFSFISGVESEAASYSEATFGTFGTTYTASNLTGINSGDRLFSIHNGTGDISRADAFIMLKNGNIGINIDSFEANDNGKKLQINGTVQLHKDITDDTTTAYELDIDDIFNIVTMNNAGANTLTIPANASVAFPIGSEIVITNKGAGVTTVAITTDTLNQNVGGLTLAQHDVRTLRKLTATTWVMGY